MSAHSVTLSSRSFSSMLNSLMRSINTNIGVFCLTRPQSHDLMSINHYTTDVVSSLYDQCLSTFFSGVRVARSLVFCVVFCGSLFVLLSFFFLSLCGLYFFDLRNGCNL